MKKRHKKAKHEQKGTRREYRRLYTFQQSDLFTLPGEPATVGKLIHCGDRGLATVQFLSVEPESRYFPEVEYELDRTIRVLEKKPELDPMKEAQKKYPSVWKNNIEYVAGRAQGRRSPKRPDENEWEQHVRLWFQLADDAPISSRRLSEDKIKETRRELPKDELVNELYPGKPRRLPHGDDNKPRWITIAGQPPYVLRGTKWKQIRKWAEQMVEHYWGENKQLTVMALATAVQGLGLPLEDERKVRRRLKAIYADDWLRERAEDKLLFENIPGSALRPPRAQRQPRSDKAVTDKKGGETPRRRVKGGAGLDAWGFKLGTRVEKINAAITDEPKTAKEIEAEVGCKAASSHLSKLVLLKFVEKVGRGFKLAGEGSCRTSSRSESSTGRKSTRPKEDSRSARAARLSRLLSSTDSSPKGKRGKSGRRRTDED